MGGAECEFWVHCLAFTTCQSLHGLNEVVALVEIEQRMEGSRKQGKREGALHNTMCRYILRGAHNQMVPRGGHAGADPERA